MMMRLITELAAIMMFAVLVVTMAKDSAFSVERTREIVSEIVALDEEFVREHARARDELRKVDR